MRNIVSVILLVAFAHAERTYRLCAPIDTINDNLYYTLHREGSKITCSRAADNAECAILLASGKADFAIFSAEELLMIYPFYPSIKPIFQLRHKDRLEENFESETVAVIPADLSHISVPPGERIEHLRNGGLCHPGFSKTQKWNDYILKYFEKSVNRLQCKENVTIVENEVRNLRDFFGKACRPGDWAADESLDKELKIKYSELCALCDNPTTCSYKNDMAHGHFGALECLAHGKGKVAYVALSYVRQYLGMNDTFQFLCPSGKVLPLSTINPCTWIRQPWDVIAVREEIAETTSFKTQLLEWLKPPLRDSWKIALDTIIQEDNLIVNITENTMLSYLNTGRDVELATTESCGRTIRWCTIGDMETNKCKWVARAALALGVAPKISCVQSNSTFQCFRDIAENRADIIAIDSNYGHLARTVYGLSTILYSETEMDRNSVIIAVVPEPKDDNYPVKSMYELKNQKVCFPEYGGIGWLSLIKTLRTTGIISDSCDYSSSISKLLSGACTPGIKDADHSRTAASESISNKLCSACLHQNNTSCAVNETNRYYGDKGAIRCINEGAGNVAIVEAANINDNTIHPINYRVLCKNGSLARNPGFDFDEICALSVTIDSELVGRKTDSDLSKMDIVLALLKMEDWLGYRINAQRSIHIYGPFNGTIDLLFKDSSSGLVLTSSTKKSILEYKELFSHVEECSNGALIATANCIFVFLITLYHLLPVH